VRLLPRCRGYACCCLLPLDGLLLVQLQAFARSQQRLPHRSILHAQLQQALVGQLQQLRAGAALRIGVCVCCRTGDMRGVGAA
jgi:hypothetical protein